MKNRYLKSAHISEKKVKEVLSLFCQDLTATQIANISGISRITVNSYLKLIRKQIAMCCEENNPFRISNGFFSFLPAKENENESAGHSESKERYYYGICKTGCSLYTDKIRIANQSWIKDWLKHAVAPPPDIANRFQLNLYSGIIDFGSCRLFRVNENRLSEWRERSLNEIDIFWGLLKSRILKNRGLHEATLYLHVKETEFRYNHRREDLFVLLNGILNKRPLHIIRAFAL